MHSACNMPSSSLGKNRSPVDSLILASEGQVLLCGAVHPELNEALPFNSSLHLEQSIIEGRVRGRFEGIGEAP